ncbi:MAG TPA: fibronectin type III domain-containing protein [Puia sp.]
MIIRFTRILLALLVMVIGSFGSGTFAQTGVLNPNDPIVLYNAAAPPTKPGGNTMAKWVKTTRVSYNTDDFKCYYYNNVQFRLKWPRNFTTAPAGTTFPLYLFFHGVGERGTVYDNEFQLFHGGDLHQYFANVGDFDGFLLYPQSQNTSGGWDQQQLDAIADIITKYLVPEQRVDINRISVNGLSGGGDATWQFAETHPTLPASVLPMSSASISDESYANSLKFTPIWLFQGGLDRSPDPSTTIQVVNAFNNVGANLKYTVYPNAGHDTWDPGWREPGYFPFLRTVNKANPWALTGRTQFCPGDAINVTLGVTAGLDGYQWRKNGTVISGDTSNTIQATATGTYDCRILRGSAWSAWSPAPVVISIKAPTVSPNIQVNGLASDVLPAPDSSTSVSLMVPAGYATYTWERVDSPAGHPAILSGTTNILNGATPGQYAVKVTEQFGCSSSFSNPFTVVRSNGPNPPSAPTNLVATNTAAAQIKLIWSEALSQPNPETQFEIYQATVLSGPYKFIGYSPANVDSFLATNLLPKTTYFYKVRAIDTTAASATAGPSGAQTPSDVTPPSAPVNLRAGMIDLTSVQLIWGPATDNVGVTGYDIYVNGHKTYSMGNIDTFTVYNLVNAQTYTFTVTAKDFAGNVSPFSNQLSAVPLAGGLKYSYYSGFFATLPDFKTLTPVATGTVPNITLSNAKSTTNYAFMWTGTIIIPVTGSYTFQTTSDDGSKLYIDIPYNAGAVATVNNDGGHGPVTVTSQTLTLTAGIHTFVATYMQQGGGASMSVTWKTPQTGGQFLPIPDSAFIQTYVAGGTAPAAPSALTAVAASAKKINLTWHDNSNNETGFQIFRTASLISPFAAIATVGANKTSYGDSSLSPATKYYYRIQAFNQYGSSKFDLADSVALTYKLYSPYTSSSLAAIATSIPSATGTVRNFLIGVSPFATNYALQFNGTLNIETPAFYYFYLSSDDGSSLYIDGSLCVNNDGLHSITPERYGTRTLLTGPHQIQVNYFQQGGGEALTVSYAPGGVNKTVIPDNALCLLPANATTKALPALPAAPAGLTGTAQGPTHISLSWTNNATNATGFEVWRSPATNSNYLLAATLPVMTAYVDSNLTKNTLYYYKVRAINEGGASAYSNEINVTTSSVAVTTVTLTHIVNQTLVNDTTLVIPVSAASSNTGSAITFTATGLPAFASLTDNHNGTASLTLKTNSTQIGAYTGITLTATDTYGGSSSDTFTVNVNGRNQSTVLLSFNTAASPVPAPWNGMNSAANAGVAVANLKDNNGNTTTEGVTLVTAWDLAYATGMNTGNNSGIFPDNVLKNFYAGSTSNPYTFKVTGLNSNKKYALVFYAGYPWTSSDKTAYGALVANYTVGTQTVSLDAANNTANTVQLAGLSPDAGGNITVTVSRPAGSAYCMLSALEILTYDAGAGAALIPPSNLAANGFNSSSIRMSWSASPDTRTGFEIWRATKPAGTFSLLTTVGGSVTSYTDSSLPANSTYFYQVREVVNGNQYSAFSNIAGGSVVQYTVNLSLNSQYAGSQPAPWNDLNTLITNGFTLSNMMNMKAQPTGINFKVVNAFTSFNDQLGLTTGHNTGVVPDTVMKTFYYNTQGDTARIRIDGLPRTGIFNFGFYAGTSFSNAPTVGVYQIGNQIVSLNAFNNTSNMVFINGVKPDSNGSVLITFYTGATTPYAMWTSLGIQGMPSPDVIAADSAGIGGQAAGGVLSPVGPPLQNANGVDSTDSLNNRLLAYPNPFHDNVTMKLDLPQGVSKIRLIIADASGKVIRQQEFDNLPAGTWLQTFNLGNLTRGVYFIQVYGLPGKKVKPFRLMKLK